MEKLKIDLDRKIKQMKHLEHIHGASKIDEEVQTMITMNEMHSKTFNA